MKVGSRPIIETAQAYRESHLSSILLMARKAKVLITIALWIKYESLSGKKKKNLLQYVKRIYFFFQVISAKKEIKVHAEEHSKFCETVTFVNLFARLLSDYCFKLYIVKLACSSVCKSCSLHSVRLCRNHQVLMGKFSYYTGPATLVSTICCLIILS